jgi:hypothetical protein
VAEVNEYANQRRTLRRAATLIRRIDSFLDGKLEEEGVPARVLAGDLLELANDLTMFEAMERVRGIAADEHSVKVGEPLRVIEGGTA